MKVAVFVEGLTELELVKSLITALCGQRNIEFDIREQRGGKLVSVSFSPILGATTYVLLVDCHSDDQVKTQIRDQYPFLISAGYTYVIGLRDVYPFTQADLPAIQLGMSVGMPTSGQIPIDMHLAVLEVEAWFLDELTHFQRIDASLTPAALASAGFDLATSVGADWPHPAETLDNIYRIARKRYRKKGSHIRRTVGALSFEEMYVTVRERAPTFNLFLDSLEIALF